MTASLTKRPIIKEIMKSNKDKNISGDSWTVDLRDSIMKQPDIDPEKASMYLHPEDDNWVCCEESLTNNGESNE